MGSSNVDSWGGGGAPPPPPQVASGIIQERLGAILQEGRKGALHHERGTLTHLQAGRVVGQFRLRGALREALGADAPDDFSKAI